MGARPDYLRIAVWAGATLLAVGFLVVVAWWWRRRFQAGNEKEGRSVWTLDDLNAMRRRGDLSESQYAHLRDRSLAHMGIQPRAALGGKPKGIACDPRCGADDNSTNRAAGTTDRSPGQDRQDGAQR